MIINGYLSEFDKKNDKTQKKIAMGHKN